MIVYGRNPVHEVIRGPRTVTRVWATAGAARAEWLAPLQRITTRTDAAELDRISGSDGHQGLCAEVSAYRYADADAMLAAPDPLIVALDQVQDPQNLGAIARSAEGAGVTGLILPERRSTRSFPRAVKIKMSAYPRKRPLVEAA